MSWADYLLPDLNWQSITPELIVLLFALLAPLVALRDTDRRSMQQFALGWRRKVAVVFDQMGVVFVGRKFYVHILFADSGHRFWNSGKRHKIRYLRNIQEAGSEVNRPACPCHCHLRMSYLCQVEMSS